MSAEKAAAVSGASVADAEIRRRHVGSASQAAVAPPAEADDKKKALKKQPSVLEILDEWEIVIAPLVFTAFALFTRLYKIGLSNIVTWTKHSKWPLGSAGDPRGRI